MRPKLQESEKPLHWLGDTYKRLQELPVTVQKKFGYALSIAQYGGSAPQTKLLHGRLAGAIEIVEDFDTNTYRAVYTVKFADAVYVLHVFQKKSKRGNETPLPTQRLIEQRFKQAAAHARGDKA